MMSFFEEKLELLLNIRANEHVQWHGKHRAALTGQGVYPRPHQEELPIWGRGWWNTAICCASGAAGIASSIGDNWRVSRTIWTVCAALLACG